MKAITDVSRDELRTLLTDEAVNTLRIIHLAMAGALATFCGIILFLYLGQSATVAGEYEVQLIQLMSLVHLFIAFAAYSAANFVFNAQFKSERLSATVENPGESALMLIRTALIIRLALFEAPALFGLVVTLLATLNGVLQKEPLFAVNLVSMFIFFGLVANTLPTRERLENLFVGHIHS